MIHRRTLLSAFVLCASACGAADTREPLGSLSLGLTTEAGGTSYRLANARFRLKGPESRDVASKNEDELSIELASGTYTLTLLDGWSLARVDDKAAAPVPAQLVSENPSTVSIEPGETTHTVLRFELASGAQLRAGTGTLRVGLEIDADAGAAGPACTGELRISELDYDQVGTDAAEFIEVVNAGSCDAPLAEVTLELVNGSDSKSYGHYALDQAEKTLTAGERLVVASASLLASGKIEGPTLALNSSGLQNGPDGVRLLRASALLDALAYEDALASAGEGGPLGEDAADQSWSRCPDGFDTDDNALDFALTTPTPGGENACP